MNIPVATVAGWVGAASSIVALTGAGISTESGIPDFRGPQGVWTRDPKAERLSNIHEYMTDPEVRKAAWQGRLNHPAWQARPNAGHRALVALERHEKLRAVVTQNIDGLHQAAGHDAARIIEKAANASIAFGASPTLVVVPSPVGTFALTYKATVAYAITYYVDALTGDVVRVVDERNYDTGLGTGTLGEPKKMVTTLIGGTFAFASHGTKAAARIGANLSPEPVSNWVLSLVEDAIAFAGTLLAVFAPVIIAIVLVLFAIFFFWFFPKVFRAVRRLFNAAAAFFRGESFKEVARKAG